jgi:hypothetical protein
LTSPSSPTTSAFSFSFFFSFFFCDALSSLSSLSPASPAPSPSFFSSIFAAPNSSCENLVQCRLVAKTQRLRGESRDRVGAAPCRVRGLFEGKGVSTLPCESTRSTLNIIWSCGLFEGKGVSTLPCESTRSTLNIIWSCGLFEGKGVYTSRVSPPGPLSISYGYVGCLKARACPSRVSPPGSLSISYGYVGSFSLSLVSVTWL